MLTGCGTSNSSYESKLENAQRKMEEGKTEEGVKILEELIKEDDSRVEAYEGLYYYYVSVHDTPRVAELMQSIRSLDPKHTIFIESDGETYGNTPNEFIHKKAFLYNNEYYFYQSYGNQANGIFKINGDTFELIENTELYVGLMNNFQVSGNWIYYTGFMRDEELLQYGLDEYDNECIKRFNMKTKIEEPIIMSLGWHGGNFLQIVQDTLFYNDSEGLMKSNLDGSNAEVLIPFEEAEVSYNGDKFIIYTEEEVYSYDMDGSNQQLLFSVTSQYGNTDGKVSVGKALMASDGLYVQTWDDRNEGNKSSDGTEIFYVNPNGNVKKIASFYQGNYPNHWYVWAYIDEVDGNVILPFSDNEWYELTPNGKQKKTGVIGDFNAYPYIDNDEVIIYELSDRDYNRTYYILDKANDTTRELKFNQ